MKRKKILFVIPEYSIGGTNTSLANILSLIDHERCDISILSLYEDGTEHFKSLFRPYVIKKSLLYTLIHDNVVTRKFMGLCLKRSNKASWEWVYRYEAWRIRRKFQFDVVVAFQEGLATSFSTLLKAEKRIAWVQCDYPHSVGNRRIPAVIDTYSRYDNIVCVSKYTADNMKEYLSEVNVPITFLYNILNTDAIRQKGMATEGCYEKGTFNIVSVGRLSGVKGFDLIPKMAAMIKGQMQTAFCWYIIGEGAERKRIEDGIRKYDVNDCVVLLGAKDNPYPFLREADLYVCTSESESFSYTIAEAKILHTPVLSNNFPVAYEVVDDTTGWVMPNDKMPEMIARLISDEDGIYSRVKKSISTYVYDNQAILDEFYKMISV